VPTGVAAQEAAWYLSKAGTYGVLLDPRNDYTKTDWELWTAAWLADHADARNMLINGVYGFANSTPQRVPFTDWYVVATGTQRGFADRPVIGGVLALMNAPAADSVSWKRIQNKNSGKLLAVSGMSLADSAEVTQYEDNGTTDHLWTVVDNGDGTVGSTTATAANCSPSTTRASTTAPTSSSTTTTAPRTTSGASSTTATAG
jgi:hypothetical protein